MDEHVYPAEPALAREDEAADEVMLGLRARAKAEGLWAPHLPPEAGGSGEGFLAYADLNEEIGRSVWAQLVFNCQAPDAGNGEILHLFGTDEQQLDVPAAAGRGGDAVVLLDDGARGVGRGSDRAADDGGARRRRVGDRRPQVVLVGSRGRGVRDRDGGDRAGGGAASADVPDPRSGRLAGAADRAGACLRSPRPGLVDALRGVVLGRAGARCECAGRARRRLPDRAEAARPGAYPPRDALARPDAAGVRADVLVRAGARGVRREAGRQADGAELDRRLRRRDPGVPVHDAGRRTEDRRRQRGARRDLADQVLRRPSPATR